VRLRRSRRDFSDSKGGDSVGGSIRICRLSLTSLKEFGRLRDGAKEGREVVRGEDGVVPWLSIMDPTCERVAERGGTGHGEGCVVEMRRRGAVKGRGRRGRRGGGDQIDVRIEDGRDTSDLSIK
jgi:hypothetical protein